MSLFFVISTMLEFAVVLFLKRILEWKTNMTDEAVNKIMRAIDIMDIVALLTFISLYILFNAWYWAGFSWADQM